MNTADHKTLACQDNYRQCIRSKRVGITQLLSKHYKNMAYHLEDLATAYCIALEYDVAYTWKSARIRPEWSNIKNSCIIHNARLTTNNSKESFF